MNPPTISVLMPVYNAEKYLSEAVDSVLNQTFSDFELIAVNDASTDSSLQILTSYSDPRIHIYSNKTNVGIVKTLNRAISYARADLLARQDADDISHPDRFKKQLMTFEQDSSLVMVGSNAVIIGVNGKPRGHTDLFRSPEALFYNLHFGNCFFHSSVMFKKTALLAAGGYRDKHPHTEDYDLWVRLLDQGKLRNLPEYLLTYRELTSSISRKFDKIQENEHTKILVKICPPLKHVSQPKLHGKSLQYGGPLKGVSKPQLLESLETANDFILKKAQDSNVKLNRFQLELQIFTKKLKILLNYNRYHSLLRQLYYKLSLAIRTR